MSSGLGRTQRSVVEYLGEHGTATIWELAGALTNGGGQRYADSTGGESVIRRAVRRLYEDGRLVTRTEGSAVHYAMANEEHTDGWTAYVAEPGPRSWPRCWRLRCSTLTRPRQTEPPMRSTPPPSGPCATWLRPPRSAACIPWADRADERALDLLGRGRVSTGEGIILGFLLVNTLMLGMILAMMGRR